MFNKLLKHIKNFCKEIYTDLKNINIMSVFTTPKLLVVCVLILLAIITVFANLNTLFVLKGLLSGLILYFVFLWRT